ncbi:hypothetical protein POTOM_027500 [Populus tomentosa]|uniref:Uncharacterized protein n=1 Tax=Populus tomentosa TaxID=118781 RepID=A0A8X7ZBQ8_POPTO|nr:hypothetical protein POTOM_027500 [Populus tomentosa]
MFPALNTFCSSKVDPKQQASTPPITLLSPPMYLNSSPKRSTKVISSICCQDIYLYQLLALQGDTTTLAYRTGNHHED